MGWTFPRAEEEATRLMVDYGGEPEVTDDGVVVYAFKALRKTAGGDRVETAAPRWASERLEPTPPLTGNQPGTNALIGVFNGFNLLAPFWIVPAFEPRTARLARELAVPAVRFPARVLGGLLRRPVRPVGQGAASRPAPAAPATIAAACSGGSSPAGSRASARSWPRPRRSPPCSTASWSRSAATSPPSPTSSGRVRYTFPRIDQETAALARVRAAAPAVERDAGAIVFSSAD